MARRGKRRRFGAPGGRVGFTLIEMLVVVSIIGVLASLVFPAFARAREAARKVRCLSNIRQVTLAVTMYAADYDDRLPLSAYRPAGGVGQPAADSPIWPAYVAPYLHNEDVFYCPDCPKECRYVSTWAERGQLSMGLNRDLEDRRRNVPYCASVFSNPSRTILVADSTPGETASPTNGRGFQVTGDRKPNTQAGIGSRHFGGTNVGFVDGHAAWHVSESIWQIDNPAGLLWQPWQR
jgi:prepilin-type N-terminal cleavage/methylation domain-containing protein/prepilin-type processing-associated H-X9-DG protein